MVIDEHQNGIPVAWVISECQTGETICESTCTSVLAPLREKFSWLFSPGSYSLRRFIWQADLVGVVNFVYEAFQLRRQVKQSRGFGSG